MHKMEAKRISQSTVIMEQLMQPHHANVAGNVFGGTIMQLIDEAGGMVAWRHARTHVVTASVDRIDFLHPGFIGDIVTLKASINFVGRTSMEVGVKVETENLYTGKIQHSATAFLTYVGLDNEGQPTEVPPIILETDDEKRRHEEAKRRREARIRERNR